MTNPLLISKEIYNMITIVHGNQLGSRRVDALRHYEIDHVFLNYILKEKLLL